MSSGQRSGEERRALLERAHLYLVIEATVAGGPASSLVERAVLGGVDLVQLRDKAASDDDLLGAAADLRSICARHGSLLIVNDRPDLAAEAGADGVHVGQDDASPSTARRILGHQAIVGLSTHAPAELRAAISEPVDYVSAGPVEPTPTKPGRPGTGLGYLEVAARAATRPWFVTGGVTPDTLPAMLDAGARRFVVVRWLTESPDPEAAARALRTVIDEVALA